MSASSTAHISSAASCPTRRPSRWASTAPTCSTSTRVVSPAIETSGRKEAGRALRDVGATRITERGSIESDCTMTPKRSPCCSCPTPLGTLKRKTSPRCTHRLHHRRDRQHLGSVGFIGFQCGGLGRELASLPYPLGRGEQGRTDSRGPAQTGRLQDAKRSFGIIIESDRNRFRHEQSMTERDTNRNGKLVAPSARYVRSTQVVERVPGYPQDRSIIVRIVTGDRARAGGSPTYLPKPSTRYSRRRPRRPHETEGAQFGSSARVRYRHFGNAAERHIGHGGGREWAEGVGSPRGARHARYGRAHPQRSTLSSRRSPAHCAAGSPSARSAGQPRP